MGHVAFTPSGAIGIDRRRTPVAWKIALPTAGAMPTIGVSPAPADGRSLRSSSTTSIAGASRKVLLIVDRLQAHKTPAVEGWLARHRGRIEVFYLPRYAPELNPDEYLNNDLKGQVNATGLPHDKVEVRSHLQEFMRRLLHLPLHVMNYFQHPSVQYAAAIN